MTRLIFPRVLRPLAVTIAVILALSSLGSLHPTHAALNSDALARASQAATPARVMVVHSYHPEYIWEQQLIAGIIAGLAEQGFSEEDGTLVLEEFWLDTKRNTSQEYYEQIGAAAIQAALDFQPDVVIVTDNMAITLVAGAYPDLEQPFVFAGLNNDPEDIPGLADHPNVTGVLERAHYKETLDWIAYVFPAAKSIKFMADAGVTTDAYLPYFVAALQTHEHISGEDSEVITCATFAEWQEHVLAANEKYDVLVVGTYSQIRDAEGVVMNPIDVMTWTVEHATIPTVSVTEFGVMDGALGGAVISGDTQGHEAGLLAARILKGESAAAIAPVIPARGKLVLNAAAVRRWNVTVPLDLVQVSTIYKPE